MLLMSRRHRDMSAILLSTDPPVCRKQAGVFLLVDYAQLGELGMAKECPDCRTITKRLALRVYR